FTGQLTIILKVVCLAIAAPTSNIHADPRLGAAVPAVSSVLDSANIKAAIAIHLPGAISTTYFENVLSRNL
ncbi:hypothetical protein K443DRAFT_104054, partial [Laccaria amethystina LaAM-08-1]